MGSRKEAWLASVAAPAAAAATAGRHRRRRCEAAGGPQTEHRQLAHHVRARAHRARDGGRGAGDVLLELLLAMRAAVLVDRHALLTTALDVALDELFGILLEDVRSEEHTSELQSLAYL